MKINLIVVLLGIYACTTPNQKQNSTETMTHSEKLDTENPNLKNQLDEKRAGFEAKADSVKKAVYADGIQDIVNDKITSSAKQEGEKAPNFTLTNAVGEEVALHNELEKGPVILMWYRGGWCPYCNLTLRAMQQMLPEFEKEGASLIALTPEVPDKSLSTSEKNELEFTVLSDLDNQVAREYGVVFQLTDEVKEYYENGFGLSEYNGNEKAELPLAATYVIQQDGTISYAFLDADYRNRAEPSKILEHLKE